MRIILSTLLLFVLSPVCIYAQKVDSLTVDDIYNMSLEELLKVKIQSASYTMIETVKTPGAVTTITKDDIKSTPYRNLLDLLEVNVPGASFVNHWQGPRIGMRGIIGDQNHSYLLLVNGENMNMQTRSVPIFEIQNRDLEDIEKIEIIRGPGSVIYGPGAIGGVISITTRKTKPDEKLQIGFNQNFTYRYSTLNGSFSFRKEKLKAILYASYGKSQGIASPEFYYIDRAHGYGYGYMSKSWGYRGLGTPAPNFYADFDNKPEIKLHLDIDFLDHFNFWARYTTFSFIKQQQKTAAEEGPAFPGNYGQQFIAVINNKHSISEKLRVNSSVSFQSQSHGDIRLYQGINAPFHDITQRNNSFSENKINAKALFSYQQEKFEIAFGGEYNYWFYNPEWGKEKNSFILDFSPPVRFAVLDTTSGFYQQYNSAGLVTFIDKRIDAYQFSGFFEANYKPFQKTTLLFSGRTDKHQFTEWTFSWRMVAIQELNSTNYLKLIGQHSVRLPAFSDLYAIDYYSQKESSPEKLNGIELMYSRILGENFLINASSYYHTTDQIAWLEEGRAGLVGTFDIFGIETTLNYKTKKFKAGLNYSYIQQLMWDPEHPVDAYLSNIGPDSLDYTLEDAGSNRINNLPNHQVKIVLTWSPKKSLSIHFNGRLALDYNQIDMLEMFKAIHDTYGTDETQTEMQSIYNDLLDKGYSKPSFTSNISINYHVPIKSGSFSISAYFMNLLTVNHIRYVYQFWEDGDNRQYPRQVGFVEEPLSIGIRLSLQL